MKKAALVLAVLVTLAGCAPSLFITPAAVAPDGSEFWSVVTKTNGHPAVTSIQTFNKAADKTKMIADHSGSATGAAVAIPVAALQGTGAALALGLPASLLRPDQTNVATTVTGGGATQAQGQAQGQLQGQLQGQAQGQLQGQGQAQAHHDHGKHLGHDK